MKSGAEAAEGNVPTITVSTASAAPKAFALLAANNPDLRLFCDNLTRDQIVDYLCYGRGECVASIVSITDHAITTTMVGEGRLVCVVPAEHRLSSRKSVTPEDLKDEPLSALDAQTRTLLLDEFATLIARAETTTVYVTHNLNEAVRLAHRVVVLSRRPGRIKTIIPISRASIERRDGDLIQAEALLWNLIREEACDADKEISHVR